MGNEYQGGKTMDFITRLFTGVQVNTVSPADVQIKLALKTRPFLLDVRQPEE